MYGTGRFMGESATQLPKGSYRPNAEKCRVGSLKWGAELPKALRGVWIREGYSPPQLTKGSAERRGLPQPGPRAGAEPRPQTPFQHFLAAKERLGKKKMQDFCLTW